jgi:hypothetical protein
MKSNEERSLAHSYAQRIADLFNEIELADDHGIIVFAEEGRIELHGKYGQQATVQDSFGSGWAVE